MSLFTDPLVVSTKEQLVFIGENTREIGNGNFDSMRILFVRLLMEFAGDEKEMDVGMITAGDQPTVHIEQATAPKEQIKIRIKAVKYSDAKFFNLAESLRIVRDVNFKEPNEGGTRIIVIVSANPMDNQKVNRGSHR